MVSDIRVPSSSSSSSTACPGQPHRSSEGEGKGRLIERAHTDGDRFDSDALLEMGVGGIVGVLGLQHSLAAQSVNEGSAALMERQPS